MIYDTHKKSCMGISMRLFPRKLNLKVFREGGGRGRGVLWTCMKISYLSIIICYTDNVLKMIKEQIITVICCAEWGKAI